MILIVHQHQIFTIPLFYFKTVSNPKWFPKFLYLVFHNKNICTQNMIALMTLK